MRLASLTLACLAFAARAESPLEALLARADAAHASRDEPGRAEEVRTVLAEAARLAPNDYGVLWREARRLCWLADDLRLGRDEKSRLGKQCWEVAERAVAARPDGVEGWFEAAEGVGNYSLGLGILSALAQGMEGKFKERLARAEQLDPAYQQGAVDTAWGRFYYELPWPKYDAEKSERRLRRALERNPRNVRALVYLAELELKEDRPQKARSLLEEAVSREPGAYDPPEERRWQARARELLASPAEPRAQRRER